MELKSIEKFLEEKYGRVNEGVADKAKKFMKEFNSAISLLKDDIKNSDTNQDWYVRLEYINNLIQKELKNR